MPPKTATEKLTEAKARQANMEHELQEAQAEVDWEAEEVCKEHERIKIEKQDAQCKCDKVALRAKKKCEAEAECKQNCETMACIVKSMAEVKVRVPAGKPIRDWDSDSDIRLGVLLVGVTNLVSDGLLCFFW